MPRKRLGLVSVKNVLQSRSAAVARKIAHKKAPNSPNAVSGVALKKIPASTRRPMATRLRQPFLRGAFENNGKERRNPWVASSPSARFVCRATKRWSSFDEVRRNGNSHFGGDRRGSASRRAVRPHGATIQISRPFRRNGSRPAAAAWISFWSLSGQAARG